MFKKLAVIALSLLLITNISLMANASEIKLENNESTMSIDTIRKELEPYQEVIDKINAEYGSSIGISEENLEKVYNNVINMSLSDFENNVRTHYLEALNFQKQSQNKVQSQKIVQSQEDTAFEGREKGLKPKTGLQSIRETISQTAEVGNATIWMDSVVFSPYGYAGTYIYSQIIDYGSMYSTVHNYFSATSATHSLSSDKKTCTVALKGKLMSPEGYDLLVSQNVTVYFFAN